MPTAKFPIDAAQIVGLFMASVFYGYVDYTPVLLPFDDPFISQYILQHIVGLDMLILMDQTHLGIFLITFVSCVRVLVLLDRRWKPTSEINFKMLVAAILMFIFASMDVAFGLRHNIEAFIYFDGDPIVQFNNTSDWINVMKMVNYVAQTFIGDCILVSNTLVEPLLANIVYFCIALQMLDYI